MNSRTCANTHWLCSPGASHLLSLNPRLLICDTETIALPYFPHLQGGGSVWGWWHGTVGEGESGGCDGEETGTVGGNCLAPREKPPAKPLYCSLPHPPFLHMFIGLSAPPFSPVDQEFPGCYLKSPFETLVIPVPLIVYVMSVHLLGLL